MASDGWLPSAVLKTVERVLSQYGTSVHLALLTVAPIVLPLILGRGSGTGALFWLAVLAAVWVLMNPSVRWGEFPRDARRRIGFEIARDPFFFASLLVIIVAAIRAFNGGIEVTYDLTARIWRLNGPKVEYLPGSVGGAGAFSLASAFGLAVVVLGVRHALGSRARFAYLLLTSVLGCLSVGVMFGLQRGTSGQSFSGSFLTIFLLFGVTAWTKAMRASKAFAEIFLSIAVSGLVVGLFAFAPAADVWISVLLALLLFSLGVVRAIPDRRATAWLGTALGLVLVVFPVTMLALGAQFVKVPWPLFPDGFFALRDATMRVAISAWRDSSWLGRGLGAYPLAFGFYASPSDWQLVAQEPLSALNGFVQFLFERGVFGAFICLGVLAALVQDLVRRFLHVESGWTVDPGHLLGPVVLLAVISLSFFESTFAQLEMLIPVAAAFAVSTATFQWQREEHHG